MMIHISDSPMGRNIRRLRRKKGISRLCLARLCGMKYWTLFRIETGILRELDYLYLKNLCTVRCTSVEELVEGDCKL